MNRSSPAGGVLLVLALLSGACGGVRPHDDAASPTDAAVDVPDDASDAATAAGPTRVELVGGGERLRGGVYTVELTVGVAADPTTVQGGDVQVESGTAVHP